MEREPNRQPGQPDPSAPRRATGDALPAHPTTREFYRLAIERLLDVENVEEDPARCAEALARVAEFRILVSDATFDNALLRAERLRSLHGILGPFAEARSERPEARIFAKRIAALRTDIGDVLR